MPSVDLAVVRGTEAAARVAVVTEGAVHPGDEVTRALARAGAVVVLFSRDAVAARRIVAELVEDGARAVFLDVDPGCPEDMRDALDETHRLFARVDLLIEVAVPDDTAEPDAAESDTAEPDTAEGFDLPRSPAATVFGAHFAARGSGEVVAIGDRDRISLS